MGFSGVKRDQEYRSRWNVIRKMRYPGTLGTPKSPRLIIFSSCKRQLRWPKNIHASWCRNQWSFAAWPSSRGDGTNLTSAKEMTLLRKLGGLLHQMKSINISSGSCFIFFTQTVCRKTDKWWLTSWSHMLPRSLHRIPLSSPTPQWRVEISMNTTKEPGIRIYDDLRGAQRNTSKNWGYPQFTWQSYC